MCSNVLKSYMLERVKISDGGKSVPTTYCSFSSDTRTFALMRNLLQHMSSVLLKGCNYVISKCLRS